MSPMNQNALKAEDEILGGTYGSHSGLGAAKRNDGLPSNVVRVDKQAFSRPIEMNGSAGVLVPDGGFATNVGVEKHPVYDAKRRNALRAEIGSEPITGLEARPVYRAVKRAFDIVFSAAVLVCFSWLYAIIALVIKIDDPHAPVIFKQERVKGLDKDGNPIKFTMYKFRTMCVDAEDKLDELKAQNEKTGPVFKMANDPRVTAPGRLLRKLSLDEMTQFFNVLKGDISIVGPRPALPDEVAQYTDYQKQRLAIKPGITCYWQTRRNRDTITFDEWVDLGLLYARKCNVRSDAKLIIQTVGCVLTAQGS